MINDIDINELFLFCCKSDIKIKILNTFNKRPIK